MVFISNENSPSSAPIYIQLGGYNSGAQGRYTYYENGTHDLCLSGDVPRLGSVTYLYRSVSSVTGDIRNAVATKVRLEVKWGGDCETVYLDKDGISGDHRFQLYRRSGDLANPWGCRRK